ncbi:cytochrome P450, partial [Suillus weaverae]
ILNQDVIILNSEEVARALLEKRPSNYSDRPRFATMELQVIRFRALRLTHTAALQAFRPEAAVIYRPMQLRKVHQLLVGLLYNPTKYELHLETHSASIVMSAVYDYDTKPSDPLISMIRGAMDKILHAETPDKAAIIDSYFFLTLIPAWFPGASFKCHTLELKSVLKDMVEKPFEYALDRIAFSPLGCLPFPWSLKDSRDFKATHFNYLALQTHVVLLVFIQAMVLNPEVQKRAQAKIDRVVGSDRLPDFGDRVSMSYIEAVLRKAMRFYPIVPLGAPHATVDDDVYEGYFIPKGE